MARIRRIVDRENDLTIFKITGVLREGDIITALAEHFCDNPTLNSIFDSSEGDWSQNSNEYYLNMIRDGKSFAREGAKTAFVYSSPVDFGIGRMLENHCEDMGYKNVFACFYTLDEALSWLSQTNHQESTNAIRVRLNVE